MNVNLWPDRHWNDWNPITYTLLIYQTLQKSTIQYNKSIYNACMVSLGAESDGASQHGIKSQVICFSWIAVLQQLQQDRLSVQKANDVAQCPVSKSLSRICVHLKYYGLILQLSFESQHEWSEKVNTILHKQWPKPLLKAAELNNFEQAEKMP